MRRLLLWIGATQLKTDWLSGPQLQSENKTHWLTQRDGSFSNLKSLIASSLPSLFAREVLVKKKNLEEVQYFLPASSADHKAKVGRVKLGKDSCRPHSFQLEHLFHLHTGEPFPRHYSMAVKHTHTHTHTHWEKRATMIWSGMNYSVFLSASWTLLFQSHRGRWYDRAGALRMLQRRADQPSRFCRPEPSSQIQILSSCPDEDSAEIRPRPWCRERLADSTREVGWLNALLSTRAVVILLLQLARL